MRADRLLAVLMLLQARGTVTAAEVAAELEVSERTARRDLEALSVSGVPVYSQQGRNGGWRLIGGARTDLTGLTEHEARALFLVAGPAVTDASPEARRAVRKLVQALPEPFRRNAEAATTSFVVDSSGWGRPTDERTDPPHLAVLQEAVIDGVQVRLGYVSRSSGSTTRVVHPLGLAAKRGVWYLVADTEAGMRTFRVDRATGAVPTGDPVVRPEGFDLAAAWRLVTETLSERWAIESVQGLAEPDALPAIRSVLRDRLRLGPPAGDGRIQVEVVGYSARTLARELAGWGRRLEITGPPEARAELASIAAELTERYERPASELSPRPRTRRA